MSVNIDKVPPHPDTEGLVITPVATHVKATVSIARGMYIINFGQYIPRTRGHKLA